jgi:predicted Zn-dependent protease
MLIKLAAAFILPAFAATNPLVLTHPAPAAAVTATPVAKLAAGDSEEIALGAALAQQFYHDRGIAPSEENRRFEAYLQGIADSVGKYTHRKLPWTIHFDPNPGFRSGFALPGGHIVIGGGILALMGDEDEAAAVIAHEMIHIDENQVTDRIAKYVAEKHRSETDPSQWKWQEFGASYGAVKENLCDYDGAKLLVKAGYSPYAYGTMLQAFVALARVHTPNAPAPKAIVDRIDQIDKEIVTYHWQDLTKTRPLNLPGSND